VAAIKDRQKMKQIFDLKRSFKKVWETLMHRAKL
jgi:hypothetical protein